MQRLVPLLSGEEVQCVLQLPGVGGLGRGVVQLLVGKQP